MASRSGGGKNRRPVVTRWVEPTLSPGARALLGVPEESSNQTIEERKAAAFEVVEDLLTLFDHFGIERGEWPVLAYRLAVEGGFIAYKTRGSGPGRKSGLLLRHQLELWAHVQLFLRKHPAKLPVDALRQLAKTRKGKWFGVSLKSLQNRYSEAQRNELLLKIKCVFEQQPESRYKIAEMLTGD